MFVSSGKHNVARGEEMHKVANALASFVERARRLFLEPAAFSFHTIYFYPLQRPQQQKFKASGAVLERNALTLSLSINALTRLAIHLIIVSHSLSVCCCSRSRVAGGQLEQQIEHYNQSEATIWIQSSDQGDQMREIVGSDFTRPVRV